MSPELNLLQLQPPAVRARGELRALKKMLEYPAWTTQLARKDLPNLITPLQKAASAYSEHQNPNQTIAQADLAVKQKVMDALAVTQQNGEGNILNRAEHGILRGAANVVFRSVIQAVNRERFVLTSEKPQVYEDALEIANQLRWSPVFEMVADKVGTDNPFRHLREAYEKGATKIFFVTTYEDNPTQDLAERLEKGRIAIIKRDQKEGRVPESIDPRTILESRVRKTPREEKAYLVARVTIGGEGIKYLGFDGKDYRGEFDSVEEILNGKNQTVIWEKRDNSPRPSEDWKSPDETI